MGALIYDTLGLAKLLNEELSLIGKVEIIEGDGRKGTIL